METIYLTGLIFFFAGFVQGMTGFGSALVAMPLLSLIMDIKFAVPLSALNSLVITSFLTLKLENHLDKKKLTPLCLATLPGIIVGVTLLKHVASETIALLLGLLIIFYSSFNLIYKQRPHQLNSHWSYVAGFCSGAIGSAFSAGGPPVIIYSTLTGWKKDEIKATLTGYFLFTSILTVAAHLLTKLTTTDTLIAFVLSAPFVLLGTIIGSYCYGFFKSDAYLKTVYTLLILMGIMMIFIKT